MRFASELKLVSYRHFRWLSVLLLVLSLGGVVEPNSRIAVGFQGEATPATELEELERQAAEGGQSEPADALVRGIDGLSLLMRGGWVMLPLAIVSIFVVMWSFERWFSLRSSRVLPRSLHRNLTQMIRKSDALPVQDAYRNCVETNSIASRVIATTLVRTGRPLSEIENTANDALQRELDNATGPVRWIAFLAGVAPLLGLLGTVWGLIRAFHDTTQLDPSQNRAEVLATGIYEALVTTLAGLIIAIPAAAIAQYFENRITRQFRKIEDLIATLLPKLEHYENRLRFDPIGQELAPRTVNKDKVPAPPRVEPASVVGATTSADVPLKAREPATRRSGTNMRGDFSNSPKSSG